MIEKVWNNGIGGILSYLAAFLLIANIVYVLYSFAFKKSHYENLFITFAIYFSAFIVDPISASIKFNSKYGYEVMDILYFGIIIYILVMAIVRNNNFFMYNKTWESFYDATKEIFRKRGIDSYFRYPTIYVGNGEASITHIVGLFSKRVIIVKYEAISSVIDIGELNAAIREQSESDKVARYYYLIVNLIITTILLVNLRF